MEKTFHYKYKGKWLKPIISIALKHGEKEIELDTVIDSGADYSILDANFAEQIGIPVTRFQQLEIQGIASSLKGNLINVKSKVLDEFFEMPALFVKNYSGPFNILGRKGFFEKHRITFDE
ncbi:MAG: hypothetical protein V1722_01080 [Candidatus Micrarchaeota archaeon]